jgi:hypothetical protein
MHRSANGAMAVMPVDLSVSSADAPAPFRTELRLVVDDPLEAPRAPAVYGLDPLTVSVWGSALALLTALVFAAHAVSSWILR